MMGIYGESDAEDRTAGKMNRVRPKRRFMDAVKQDMATFDNNFYEG